MRGWWWELVRAVRGGFLMFGMMASGFFPEESGFLDIVTATSLNRED